MATHRFHTIALIGKRNDPGSIDLLTQLIGFLGDRGHDLLLDQVTAADMPQASVPVHDIDDLGKHCDLALVVGGDGTLLHAARHLSDHNMPIVGINRGRLGFLVDISPEHMIEHLGQILEGDYYEEPRCLLHADVIQEGEVTHSADALNDVVLHKWEVGRMIEFVTNINDRYVHTTRADGMIVSTPTGSTAYALSGGGPVIEPSLDAMVLVPICPHTLSNRPLVVPGHNEIEITLAAGERNQAQVTWDGQIHHRVGANDRIRVRRKEGMIRLLHPRAYDYYEILREKLSWAEHHTGK